uniref:F-box/FBD/LRR-repeat protein n=1 Tax=Noccaea caerulescens TaxID=107243 RepID=A0A1J3HYX0_NOCCA
MIDHRSGGEDRISLLPDALLSQVLFSLSTKDAVKTSLLSTRWRSLWLSIPGLELDDDDFPNYKSFVSFVDRFFLFSTESTIEKLKLASNKEKCNPLAVKSWVDAAVNRRIQHLEIDFSKRCLGFDLLSTDIFVSQTLVCLRLRYVALNDFNRVSLPRLKTMLLEEVRFLSHTALESLIASCPVLEDLSVITSRDDVKVLRVCSQTVNRLVITSRDDVRFFRVWDAADREVVIDAPRLEFLSLEDYQSSSITMKNSLCSSAQVDLAVDFNVRDVLSSDDSAKRSSIGHFLANISNVRDMTICSKTLKVIRHYCKLESLPQFCYMTQLHAKISSADLEVLQDLLESCPGLKSLVLELSGSVKKKEEISFSSLVPWCLRSCLERVEMRRPIYGVQLEMKVIKYFLENSTVLKKLTLRLGCPRMQQESMIFMELLKFRRCSTQCEVDVVGLEETLMKL